MKTIKTGNRVMDRAWYRDIDDVTHTGEALVLACLLHVKKQRTKRVEEELKEILDIYGNPTEPKTTDSGSSKD